MHITWKDYHLFCQNRTKDRKKLIIEHDHTELKSLIKMIRIEGGP